MDLGSITKQIKTKLDRTKSLEFDGITFVIGLPTAKDEREINRLLESLGTVNPGEVSGSMDTLKMFTCAYSLREVNGDVVPEYFLQEGENGKVVHVPRVEALKKTLSEWPSYILDAIYEAAADLRAASKKELDDKVKFNWFQKPDLTKDFMAEETEAAAAEPTPLVKLDIPEGEAAQEG